jgi:transposase
VDHPVRQFDHLLRSAAFSDTFETWAREYVLIEGKPPYHPRDLSALYLYGMLNRIRSSRQLETACHSRLDVIWLMQYQKPDHTTIAGFVSKHSKHLRQLFRDVLSVAVRAQLVPLAHVSVDGSKVEGDAGKSSVRSKDKIESWLGHVDDKIAALETEWQGNERREESLFGQESPWTPPKNKSMKQQLATLKRQQARLNKALESIQRRRQESSPGNEPKAIASTTDPDARVMKDKEGRRKPNYSTQLAVDEAHGVIVGVDVNDQPEDTGQLKTLVQQTEANCGQKPESVSADSGYNTGSDLATMEQYQVDTYMPDAGCNSENVSLDECAQQAIDAVHAGLSLTSAQWEALPKSRGFISRAAFVFDPDTDTYRCPAGQSLAFVRTSLRTLKSDTVIRRQYGASTACGRCARGSSCCKKPDKGRIINRDQYEECRERLRQRMASPKGKAIYARRKSTVEPRFGHIKHALGVRRFLRRGLNNTTTEWFMTCTVVNLGILLHHWDEVSAIL